MAQSLHESECSINFMYFNGEIIQANFDCYFCPKFRYFVHEERLFCVQDVVHMMQKCSPPTEKKTIIVGLYHHTENFFLWLQGEILQCNWAYHQCIWYIKWIWDFYDLSNVCRSILKSKITYKYLFTSPPTPRWVRNENFYIQSAWVHQSMVMVYQSCHIIWPHMKSVLLGWCTPARLFGNWFFQINVVVIVAIRKYCNCCLLQLPWTWFNGRQKREQKKFCEREKNVCMYGVVDGFIWEPVSFIRLIIHLLVSYFVNRIKIFFLLALVNF